MGTRWGQGFMAATVVVLVASLWSGGAAGAGVADPTESGLAPSLPGEVPPIPEGGDGESVPPEATDPLAPVWPLTPDALGPISGATEPGDDTSDPEDDAQDATPTDPNPQPGDTPAQPGRPSPEGTGTPPPGEEGPSNLAAMADVARDVVAAGTPLVPVVDLTSAVWLPSISFVDIAVGPRSSRDITDALLRAGATRDEIAQVLAPFPVAGAAQYGNDWGVPRHNPYPHPHQGTDIFASRGTPVVASLPGVVTGIGIDTAVGGNSLRVTQPDGTYAYYAHLDGFAPGVVEGTFVRVGAILGYVGTTGNAAGTPPHLHYELRPGGGEAIPPLPYLDQWLAGARDRAQAFIQAAGGVFPTVGAPVVAPGRVPVTPFLRAAATKESPISGLVMVAVMVAAVILVRRRRRWLAPLAGLLARRSGWLPHRRPAGTPGRLITFPFESSATDESSRDGQVVDVLEPFLSRRHASVER